MHGLEQSKAKIGDFFPASLRRGESGVSLSAAVVQIIDSPRPTAGNADRALAVIRA